MSLFPAYAKSETHQPESSSTTRSEKQDEDSDAKWLENKSYQNVSSQRRMSSDSSSDQDDSIDKHRRKRRRSRSPKKIRKKHSKHSKPEENLDYAKDKKGERQLLYSSCLPFTKVPLYKARWKRHVLGSIRDRGITNASSDSVRFYHKSWVKKLNKSDPLDLSQTTKHRPNPDVLKSYFVAFRGTEIEPDDSDDQEFELNQIQAKTKEYNEKLRRDPSDIDLWLEFVEFQDQAMADFNSDEKKKKKASNVLIKSKAIVEKKLSVLKTAMDKNPHSFKLAVERLRLSKEISDNESLERQWHELLLMFPDDLEVLRQYLDFNASHFTSFSVSKVTKSFKTCFKKLLSLQASSTGQTLLNIQDEMVNLIAKLCNFWSDAGYTERSVALYQGLVELNLFSPDFPGYYSLEDRLAMFEPFWESGARRFGEGQDVQGWADVIKNKPNPDQELIENPNNDTMEDSLIAEFKDVLPVENLWLKLELSREQRHWLPWRSVGDEAEDPDRCVPFEDIQDFLFQATDSKTGPVLLKLVLNFLKFLGARPKNSMFNFMGANQLSVVNQWFKSGDDDEAPCSGDLVHAKSYRNEDSLKSFVRNAVKQLLRVLKPPCVTEIAAYWMMYECGQVKTKAERKETSKLIKTIIKPVFESGDNEELYCVYARVTYQLEGHKSSQKILQMMKATFQRSLKVRLTQLSIELLESLARKQPLSGFEFDDDNWDKLRLMLEKSSKVTEEDKYCNHLMTFFDEFTARVVLHCWQIYLVQNSAQNAYNFIDLVLDKVDRNRAELLHQLRVDMMYYSMQFKDYSEVGKLWGMALCSAVKHAPANTHFLEVLTSKFNMFSANFANKYWRSMSTALSTSQTPVSKVSLVLLLMSRSEASMGYMNQANKYLNEFLLGKNSGNGNTSVILWRLLLWICNRSCLQQQETYYKSLSKYAKPTDQFEPLKSLLFRALQDNPGSKALCLDVLHYYCQNPIKTEFSRSFQRELQDLMTEKEVRVRIPMEELEVLLEDE